MGSARVAKFLGKFDTHAARMARAHDFASAVSSSRSGRAAVFSLHDSAGMDRPTATFTRGEVPGERRCGAAWRHTIGAKSIPARLALIPGREARPSSINP